MINIKKTKIICTIGPACEKENIMRDMIEAGMNAARINFSHGSPYEHMKKINMLKKVRQEMNKPIALILDTRGPEIRIGEFENGQIHLKKGQVFKLTSNDVVGNDSIVSISLKNLPTCVKDGDEILIDDGKIHMTVSECSEEEITCVVTNGGVISNRKGINVPSVQLNIDYLSDKDKEDIIFGIKMGVDYIAASFVRTVEDVIDLKNFLIKNGGEDIKVIAKIENSEGVKNIDEIIDQTDGIMVARGDMGVEINFEKIPGIQKHIIRKCIKKGKISITATQMLESMTENIMPTRAEITDVANAVYDGTSAVMLSGETAVGKFPVEAIRTMTKIVCQAEREQKILLEKDLKVSGEIVSDAVGHAACQAAIDLNARILIAITNSGYTSEKMSKYRSNVPIVAFTPRKKTFNQQALVWGVNSILTGENHNWNKLQKEVLSQVCNYGFANEGDLVVISAGMPPQASGKTNMIYVTNV